MFEYFYELSEEVYQDSETENEERKEELQDLNDYPKSYEVAVSFFHVYLN